MARLDAYCIDRYEAHLIEQLADGRELSHAHFQRPAAGARYLARSDSGEYPQAYISRVEAQRACEAGGKRLCTVSEWYGACRGSHDQPYPYGNRFINGRCNSSKAHLLSRFFGVNPRAWKYQDFNHPMLDQQPGFLAKSGEYSGCASELGVYDMVGNLHEWVSDTAGPSLTAKLPLRTGILRSLRRNRGHGIFMGGFFSTTSEFGRGCAFVTVGHEPDYHDYSTGFRCCADAPKG
jgi:formylglycine-generating enzyme required for sulfatase activity